jgi:1,4-dihydroxy-2-naphthoate octaprenyltransferase
MAGWAAARGEIASAWTEVGVLGAMSAALTTLGMYPLTQVFQIEEDSRRGDRTICVVLGAEKGLLLSGVAFILAGVAAVTLAIRHYTLLDTAILAGAYGFLLVYVGWFKRDYASLRGSEAFRRVLFLNYTASGAFLLFICAHVFRNG